MFIKRTKIRSPGWAAPWSQLTWHQCNVSFSPWMAWIELRRASLVQGWPNLEEAVAPFDVATWHQCPWDSRTGRYTDVKLLWCPQRSSDSLESRRKWPGRNILFFNLTSVSVIGPIHHVSFDRWTWFDFLHIRKPRSVGTEASSHPDRENASLIWNSFWKNKTRDILVPSFFHDQRTLQVSNTTGVNTNHDLMIRGDIWGSFTHISTERHRYSALKRRKYIYMNLFRVKQFSAVSCGWFILKRTT